MLKRTIVALLAALMLTLAPAATAGEAPKPELGGAFKLAATHGYKILGLLSVTESVGTVSLIVSKGHGAAVYAARGTGSANAVDIDLGRLGRIDAEVRPTGTTETIHRGCKGNGPPVSIPGYELAGTIEFRGEDGFTEASTTQTPLLAGPLAELVCGGVSSGESSGESLKGVRLAARSAEGVSLSLIQNHRGAAVFYEASEHESEGPVQVYRTIAGHLRAGALRFEPTLSSAHFVGSSPFGGSASYGERTPPHQSRPGRGTWRGSLKVDFPGDPGARLAGPGFKASIIHAQRIEPSE